MPRAFLPLQGGQNSNLDDWSSPQATWVCNLIVDETGQNKSRPGLRLFGYTSAGGVITAGSDGRTIGLTDYGPLLIAVDATRHVWSFTQSTTGGSVAGTDITTDKLAGIDYPSFLLDTSGRLLIFGGGAILSVATNGRATRFVPSPGDSPSPTHGVIIDGYLVTNDKGSSRIYFSNPVDHTQFDMTGNLGITGSGFFDLRSAGGSGYPCLALASLSNELYTFTQVNVEVWRGTGDSASPFIYAWSVPSDLGAARSVLNADATIWWLDNHRRIVRMDGRAPKVVSFPIEKQLQALSTVNDCVAQLLEMNGTHYASFTFPTAGITLAYDWVRNHWVEFRQWDPVNNAWLAMPFLALSYQRQWGQWFCAGQPDGSVLRLDADTYTDYYNGVTVPIRRIRRMPFVDHGSLQRKASHRYLFTIDGGVSTSLIAGTDGFNPNLMVSWRDERRIWTRPRPLALGKVGNNRCVIEMRRCGDYQRRQLQLEYAGQTAFAVAQIEEDFEPRTT